MFQITQQDSMIQQNTVNNFQIQQDSLVFYNEQDKDSQFEFTTEELYNSTQSEEKVKQEETQLDFFQRNQDVLFDSFEEKEENQYDTIEKEVRAYDGKTNEPYVFKNFKLSLTKGNHLLFSHLLEQLKFNGVPLNKQQIFICQDANQNCKYVEMDPLPKLYFVDFADFANKKHLSIMFQSMEIPKQLSLTNTSESEEDKYSYKCNQVKKVKITKRGKRQQDTQERRVKERYIGFVYEKVKAWRKLYNEGIQGQNGTEFISLYTAANMVGLSRKSLDNYFAEITKAEKNGFDLKLINTPK